MERHSSSTGLNRFCVKSVWDEDEEFPSFYSAHLNEKESRMLIKSPRNYRYIFPGRRAFPWYRLCSVNKTCIRE